MHICTAKQDASLKMVNQSTAALRQAVEGMRCVERYIRQGAPGCRNAQDRYFAWDLSSFLFASLSCAFVQTMQVLGVSKAV